MWDLQISALLDQLDSVLIRAPPRQFLGPRGSLMADPHSCWKRQHSQQRIRQLRKSMYNLGCLDDKVSNHDHGDCRSPNSLNNLGNCLGVGPRCFLATGSRSPQVPWVPGPSDRCAARSPHSARQWPPWEHYLLTTPWDGHWGIAIQITPRLVVNPRNDVNSWRLIGVVYICLHKFPSPAARIFKVHSGRFQLRLLLRSYQGTTRANPMGFYGVNPIINPLHYPTMTGGPFYIIGILNNKPLLGSFTYSQLGNWGVQCDP